MTHLIWRNGRACFRYRLPPELRAIPKPLNWPEELKELVSDSKPSQLKHGLLTVELAMDRLPDESSKDLEGNVYSLSKKYENLKLVKRRKKARFHSTTKDDDLLVISNQALLGTVRRPELSVTLGLVARGSNTVAKLSLDSLA